MAETTHNDLPRLADANSGRPEDEVGDQSEYDTWLTEAHAPGDPPPPQHAHDEVGTD
jgi:hypothetical protein